MVSWCRFNLHFSYSRWSWASFCIFCVSLFVDCLWILPIFLLGPHYFLSCIVFHCLHILYLPSLLLVETGVVFLCFAVDSAAVNDVRNASLTCSSVCMLNLRSRLAWSKGLCAREVNRYCQILCPCNGWPYLTPPPAVYLSASFLPASEPSGLVPF